MLWFNKSRRAQSDTDYETWLEGGVVPTLNGFDNGDVRATTIILRMREGKPGGGKGPLLSEDRSLTLATANDQTMFVFGFSHTQGLDAQPREEGTPTLRANGAGMAVNYSSVVRRLTPLECERLQGFPDGWTEGQTDTNRYKQMGNAVAVPVVDWIIGNLVK
jgi:site-specific DNA-cytosine methylase